MAKGASNLGLQWMLSHRMLGLAFGLMALVGTLLSWGAAQVTAQEADKEYIPAVGGLITRFKIPNGPTVLLQSRPGAGAVGVALVVPGGSQLDPPGRWGSAHLLEHLVFRATKHFHSGKLLLELGKTGARWGASTTPTSTTFWQVVPADSLSLALSIQADRLCGLAVSPAALERERRLIAQEISSLHDRPERRVESYLRQQLNPGMALSALNPDGQLSDLQRITIPELKALYARIYRPEQAVLCLVGGFQAHLVEMKLRSMFAEARFTETSKLNQQLSGSLADETVTPADTEHSGFCQEPGVVMLGCKAPSITEKDYPTLLVLNAILMGGRTARLPNLLAQEGLEHRVRLLPSVPFSNGLYRLGTWSAPEVDLSQVSSIIRQAWRQVSQSPVSAMELQAAISQAKAGQYKLWEDYATRAVSLARSCSQGALQPFLQTTANIEQVTADEVLALAQRLARPENCLVYESEQGAPLPPVRDYLSAGEVFALADPIERMKTSNGITLLVKTDSSLPLVTLTGYIRGGALLDPPGRAGLTSLAAAILGKGTKSLSWQEFNRALDEQGMELRFSYDGQVIRIEGRCLSESLPAFVQLLSEAVQHAQASPAAFAQAKEESAALLRRQQGSFANVAIMAFLNCIFPADHPFTTQPQDSLEVLETFTPEETQEHLASLLRPERLVLAWTGEVSSSKVQSLVEDNLHAWSPVGELSSRPSAQATQQEPQRIVLPYTGKQAMVLVGQLGPARRDPDYQAFSLLNQIIGGNPHSSRLGLRIVHMEHLGTAASSSIIELSGSSPWAACLKVKPEKVNRALAIVRQELRRLSKPGPSDREMAAAIAYLNGQNQVKLVQPRLLTELMCSLEYHQQPQEWLSQSEELYRHINASQLRAVAQKWMNPDSVAVVIGKPSTYEPGSSQ